MLWSVAAFAAVYFSGVLILDLVQTAEYEKAAMHFLMAAYFAHLLARTVYLTVRWGRIDRDMVCKQNM